MRGGIEDFCPKCCCHMIGTGPMGMKVCVTPGCSNAQREPRVITMAEALTVPEVAEVVQVFNLRRRSLASDADLFNAVARMVTAMKGGR